MCVIRSLLHSYANGTDGTVQYVRTQRITKVGRRSDETERRVSSSSRVRERLGVGLLGSWVVRRGLVGFVRVVCGVGGWWGVGFEFPYPKTRIQSVRQSVQESEEVQKL